MELKRYTNEQLVAELRLLIVPYGIETWSICHARMEVSCINCTL